MRGSQASVTFPSLLLSGERHNNHFEVAVGGKAVPLRCSELRVLVALIIARLTTDSGFISFNRVAVSRLRHVLDLVAGCGTGKTLIQTGCGKEYRLALSRPDVSKRVVVSPSFFELQELDVFSAQQAKELRPLCGKRSPSETARKQR